MREKILIIFIFLFVFSACKKQVDKKRPEFIGYWSAVFEDDNCIVIDISQNSSATVTQLWDGHQKDFNGTARANDNHLKINATTYFKIIEYPHKIDSTVEIHYVNYHNGQPSKLANWRMVLEGINPSWLHISGTRTFYKADY